MSYTVTPWEVKGNIDYQKLLKEFGVAEIDQKLLQRIEKKAGSLHPFLRRKIFFGQRDLKFVLDEYDKKNKFFLYTGRAPSGPVHLGHLIPWMFTKWLQDVYDVELYFQFPDEEKYLFKQNLEWEESQKYLKENMIDVAAIGFNPEKTHFIIDTKHAHLLYPEAIKVAKKITYSTAKAAFGFSNETNIGSIFYTSMQAVPSFLPSILHKKKMPCLIPHAIDQDPHFRLSRDVIPKLGFYKPASIQCSFFPGLAGMQTQGKMSSSNSQSTIFSTDDAKTIKNKINKYAFSGGGVTVEEHRKNGGNPNIDIAYQWLSFFEESDEKLKQIHDDYKKGNLLSGELKAITIKKVTEILEKHQERRKTVSKNIDKFILKA